MAVEVRFLQRSDAVQYRDFRLLALESAPTGAKWSERNAGSACSSWISTPLLRSLLRYFL